MSLATRCSACGTMFRVVQDQLRVSEGWVRCGRCDAVFNALDALVDLEAEAAAEARTRAALPATDPPAPTAHDDEHWTEGDAGHVADRFDDDAPVRSDHDDVHDATTWDEAPLPADALAQDSAHFATATTLTQAAATEPSEAGIASEHAAAAAEPAVTVATPGFVRRAERDARWTSPAMRAALIGSALMLLAVLLLQAGYHFRDALAARSPAAGELLRSACARWGCRIEAPRRLSDVTLEGSALSRVAQQPKAVKLLINLRNRGNTELALPSIDLSLTDAKGQLIARRALSPSDFRIDPPVIARNAELPLEMVLSAGEQNISGYTVELFYP